MKTKAYLLHLSGQGDFNIAIIDEDSWKYIVDNAPATTAMVKALQAEHDEDDYYTDEPSVSVADFRNDYTGSSPDNDRAFNVTQGSIFNGERYSAYENDPVGLVAFINKHNLDLQEEKYEGYIY